MGTHVNNAFGAALAWEGSCPVTSCGSSSRSDPKSWTISNLSMRAVRQSASLRRQRRACSSKCGAEGATAPCPGEACHLRNNRRGGASVQNCDHWWAVCREDHCAHAASRET